MVNDNQNEVYKTLGINPERVKPIDTDPLRSYEYLFDLPLSLDRPSYIRSPNATASSIINATTVEGRAFGLVPIAFKFVGGMLNNLADIRNSLPKGLFLTEKLRSTVLYDLITKGVGLNKSKQIFTDSDAVFLSREAIGRDDPGPPAGAVSEKNEKMDEVMSLWFHSIGGRTRLPVRVRRMETIRTPHGNLSQEEARTQGYNTSESELVQAEWAMRCRLRVDDIYDLLHCSNWKSTSDYRYMSPTIKAGPDTQEWHINYHEQEFYRNNWPDVQGKLQGLASFILARCDRDENEEWQNFFQKYANPEQRNMTSFYSDYMELLFGEFGTQLGLLNKHDIVLKLFNFQNFTLLGEIVDLDVAAKQGHYRALGYEYPASKDDKTPAAQEAEIAGQALSEILGLMFMLNYTGKIFNDDTELMNEVISKTLSKFCHNYVASSGLAENQQDKTIAFLSGLEGYMDSRFVRFKNCPNPIFRELLSQLQQQRKTQTLKTYITAIKKIRGGSNIRHRFDSFGYILKEEIPPN